MMIEYLYMDSKSSLNPASTVRQLRRLAVLISDAQEYWYHRCSPSRQRSPLERPVCVLDLGVEYPP